MFHDPCMIVSVLQLLTSDLEAFTLWDAVQSHVQKLPNVGDLVPSKETLWNC